MTLHFGKKSSGKMDKKRTLLYSRAEKTAVIYFLFYAIRLIISPPVEK